MWVHSPMYSLIFVSLATYITQSLNLGYNSHVPHLQG